MPDPKYNPYNFVPLPPEGPKRSPFPGLARIAPDSYSGVLACDLTVLTRLFTADHQRAGNDRRLPFLRDGEGKPILQGTSLKGMIRSVYEAAFPSCLPLAAPIGPSKKVYRGGIQDVAYVLTLPQSYDHASCNHLDHLCPACRLFGIIYKDKVHAQGRVVFSDARLSKRVLRGEEIHLQELSTPKPHSVIYSRNGAIRGRKFYYHHDPTSQPSLDRQGPRSNTITEYAPKDAVFTFCVAFTNLAKEELAQLISCLTLDEKHAHKLGMAKSLGYGSCRINIRQKGSFVEQGGSRYQSWKPEKPAFVETDWKIGGAWLHGDLEKLLHYPRTGAGKTGYPRLPGYKNLDIDGEGEYVTTSKPEPRKEPEPIEEAPQPIRSAIERIAEVSDRFQQASPVSALVRRAKGQKVTLVVAKIEPDEFVLRDPETGQEDIPLLKRGPSLEIGQPIKVKILEVAKDGRIKKVQSA